MRKLEDRLFGGAIRLLCLVTVLLLGFLVVFILRESLPAIREVGLGQLLLGSDWRPIIYRDAPSYGLRNMVVSTLFVSALAVLLALGVGVGCALFLACGATERQRMAITPCIELLASIPSVVYGFVGLYTVVKFLEKCGRASGESVLAGAVVLSVMILPYMVSSCCETMVHAMERYGGASRALGVSRWYMAGQLVLPAARRGILISTALSVGRAMGETMAVMMVMGNANLFPRLLGKSESIASVIALEMGTAVYGSTHYHALYAAGMVLMILLFLINGLIGLIRSRMEGETL